MNPVAAQKLQANEDANKRRKWLSSCFFSDPKYGDCNAKDGLDGSIQTKWYNDYECERRGITGLVFYKKGAKTLYRNLCGRCYAEHRPGWKTDMGVTIPFFIVCPPGERWGWPDQVPTDVLS